MVSPCPACSRSLPRSEAPRLTHRGRMLVKVLCLMGSLALPSQRSYTAVRGHAMGKALAKPALHMGRVLSRKHHTPFRAWTAHIHCFTIWERIFKGPVLLCAINSLSVSLKKLKSGLILQINTNGSMSRELMKHFSLSVPCRWMQGEHTSLSSRILFEVLMHTKHIGA